MPSAYSIVPLSVVHFLNVYHCLCWNPITIHSVYSAPLLKGRGRGSKDSRPPSSVTKISSLSRLETRSEKIYARSVKITARSVNINARFVNINERSVKINAKSPSVRLQLQQGIELKYSWNRRPRLTQLRTTWLRCGAGRPLIWHSLY